MNQGDSITFGNRSSWVSSVRRVPGNCGWSQACKRAPSGIGKKEQAEIQLVLRKGIQKSGGGWPRNSRNQEVYSELYLELEEEEYSSFSFRPLFKVFTISSFNF